MHHGIHFSQEGHRLQVFAAAVFVGQPLTVFARIVQVEHGGDSIDANAIEVKLVQPVVRRGEQESFYLGTPVIEDVCAPVLMHAQARVFVLEQGSAVITRQCPGIHGEMAGHPIQQHANVGLMAGIDKGAELVGAAEAGRGREIPRGLIAPRFIQRMLGDGQQFDMREAEIGNVIDQRSRQFGPSVETAIRVATPGAGMQFINIHGGVQPVAFCSRLKPFLVAPGMPGRRNDHSRTAGALFKALCKGVALHHDLPAVAVEDFKLVQVTCVQTGNEQFPNAGLATRAHGVQATIPVVETADNGNATGIGCPHGESHAFNAIQGDGVRTQCPPGFQQTAFVKQVQFLIGKQGAKRVRIHQFKSLPTFLNAQSPRGAGCRRFFSGPLEQSTGMHARHGCGTFW